MRPVRRFVGWDLLHKSEPEFNPSNTERWKESESRPPCARSSTYALPGHTATEINVKVTGHLWLSRVQG